MNDNFCHVSVAILRLGMCLGDALGVVIIDHTTNIKMCAADRKKNYDGVRVRVNEGLVSMRRSTQQSLNSQRGLGLP